MDNDEKMMFAMMAMMMFFGCISMVVFIIYFSGKGKGGFFFSGGGGDLPGQPLPLPDVKRKNVAPWFIIDATNEERISIQDGALKMAIVPKQAGMESGSGFKATPFKDFPATQATLSYNVFVPGPESKGGKLGGGFCIGSNPKDCSTGGDWSSTGGSYRPMWREDAVVGYIYMPFGNPQAAYNAQSKEFKQVADAKGGTGIYLWHNPKDPLKLRLGEWNSMSLSMQLNTPGKSDGWVSMTVNGKTKRLGGMKWRKSSNSQITSVDFVTFAGGSDKSWAVPSPTYRLFKNIACSAS